MTLGVRICLLAEPMEAPGFPPLSLLFSLICPLTVSSLNLINLSEGALGKHDTRRLEWLLTMQGDGAGSCERDWDISLGAGSCSGVFLAHWQ